MELKAEGLGLGVWTLQSSALTSSISSQGLGSSFPSPRTLEAQA